MENKILVTGADGFIGSHLVEHLVARSRTVRAFVYYNSFNSWGWIDSLPEATRQRIEIVTGDVRDFGCVRDAARGCTSIMHLAALISIPYSYAAAQSYVETNIGGTLNILQAARDLDLAKVVHTSTSEVYGTARFVPITEDHPLNAQSPYAATKTGADQMALSYHAAFGTPVAIVRPFNTYGPRQSARAVIPTIINQLAAGRSHLKLGALHPTRDFNFVADTVGGMIAALDSPASVGEVINLGSNHEITIGDTAALIGEVMGVSPEIEVDRIRLRPPDSEVERLWADNTKARRLIGWSPAYAGREGLRRGLTETVEWFLVHGGLAREKVDAHNI